MQKKRNYINAIVQWHEDHMKQHVIFKVGNIDLEDDMHVFGYLKSEKDIENLAKSDNDEFQVLEYWKGINNKFELPKMIMDEELDHFFDGDVNNSKFKLD